MIAAIDVQYADKAACAACLTFESWTDGTSRSEHTTLVRGTAEYTSGEFWRRELPCLLAALELLDAKPSVIVIDGYVVLDAKGKKGLGAHLYDTLRADSAVIGVAKQAFGDTSHAAPVRRGISRRPLFVTSIGIPLDHAAAAIASMHGAHRIPTLLKRVDRLSRSHSRLGNA